MFEASAPTGRLSPSSASASQPASSTQKSRLKAVRSAAARSRHRAASGSSPASAAKCARAW